MGDVPDPPRPRVLLAVEPLLLEGALFELLEKAGVDDVVTMGDDPAADLSGHYDAAVVTLTLPDGLDADLVIELPDAGGNSGEGRVVRAGAAQPVAIGSATEIISLLDEHCPGATARVEQAAQGDARLA